MQQLNFLLVFIEGLLSFFSPCILPILPIYLSILSNSNVDVLKNENNKFIKTSLFKNTILFVLGISTTFFILGSSVNILSSFFIENKDYIMVIGGIIIVFMGLFYIDIIKSELLNREKRFNVQIKEMNSLSAFILGFTFSFGWTPCIGPILASVLIMASSSSSTILANLLIFIYTIGFILPFIIVAVFYNKLFRSIEKMKSYMGIIKKICGVLLIVSGLVMVFNGFIGINQDKQYNSIKENESINEDKGNGNRESAIEFMLKDQYGNEHSLSQYKGKTVFLNFWATWCPPCRGEMPDIEELYKEYGKNNDEIIILGVASPNLGGEGSEEEVIKFLEENKYTFPVVMDFGGELVYKYDINGFPTTFIINDKGEIVKRFVGAMDKKSMRTIIENVK
ncbi:cytochrome c biogenesis protein/redoxin [Clostridium sp. D53t1_180928_C8]|uniref:cytochrome c biogenesis protein/redoxin n=1 Tax=Clostridium sp. D53t1_180928_C8 TaxID=2787101 RepID=UPI0018AAD1AA|nr:cytochrome c biogenesis protein/redoxin [Clostridium sp. D53t1_180928_C8]